MPFETFKKALEDQASAEHCKLRDYVKGLVDISRKTMGENYETWDRHDCAFRSERKADKEDRAAVAKGVPPKMILPLTFSQIMTFVAFCCMTLQQNARFYELQPTGTEDNPLTEPLEQILERDIRRNQWNAFLVQFFLDIGRFSLGCAEICYAEEYRNMRVETEVQETGPMGQPQTRTESAFKAIPVFIGNKIYPISPYRFYPDTRVPLTRYQEGEFCGSEDMFSMSSLRAMEGLINVDKIPKMTQDEVTKRKSVSRIDEVPIRTNPNQGGSGNEGEEYMTSGSVVVTKMVCDIIPSKFGGKDSEVSSLGEEKFPVRYIVWLANDKTIIRFEEAYYLHGMFPYIMAQYIPDMHKATNESLAAICEQLVEYITWLANAHKASQANSLESKWVVDPAGVDIKTLESRSPYIYLKKNASQTGVDRYIKQFTTVDTTSNAPNEISMFKELLENCTGLSGFMQGTSSSGRRSATQDKVVTQGASARGKCTLASIWDQAFAPAGKQLIANNRQEMDFETFSRIVGSGPFGTPAEPLSVEELFAIFKADPIAIASAEDFFVFDGTLPSEKAYLAQSLQEVLMEMLANPMIAQVMGFGPAQFQQLFRDIYTLRGVTPSRLPIPTAPTQPAPAPTMVPPTPELTSSVSNG